MTTQTDDEFRAECVAKMGESLGELYHLLYRDLAMVHIKWQEYRELFATSGARIDLMNKTAPAFFGRLNDALWNEVLLDICLLTDKPQKYLNVHQLLSGLPPDSRLRERVSAALDRVESATRFARDWRDRRLAHRDLDHARDPEAKPLKPASRASTEAALEALRDVMNIVGRYFGGDGIQYESAIEQPGGPGSLLWYLDGGLEAEEIRRRDGVYAWRRPRYL